MNNIKQAFYKKESGVALFVALIILMVLTIIGLSAAQRSNLQEKMAANTHINNMTFSASESALGAFVAEANVGNSLEVDHVLSELRITGTVAKKQYDLNGGRVETGYLDSNNSGGSLVATITPSVLDECNICGGFSMGMTSSSGNLGCRNFLLEGEGKLVKGGTTIKTGSTTMWAREVTVCN